MRRAPAASYARRMIPSTGSPTWDLILQIGLVGAMITLLVLLGRDYLNRR